MKILQYNILDGCKNEKRYKNLSNWIKKRDLDVLALNELNGWNLREFQREMDRIGFANSYMFEMESSPYYVGVASKEPIKVINQLEDCPVYHGLLHVKISGINFIIVHLTPFESKKREVEVKNIIEYTEDIKEPVILIGDFNSLASSDKNYYQANDAYNKILRSDILTNQHILNNKINYGPMDLLLKNNFVDTYNKKFKHTIPTKINSDSPNRNLLRIDYILCNNYTSNVYNYDCDIIHSKKTDKLSDHYPVYCELRKK